MPSLKFYKTYKKLLNSTGIIDTLVIDKLYSQFWAFFSRVNISLN